MAGGFPARTGVPMEGEEAEEPTALMDGAEVFEPDWRDIDANLSGHVDARQAATGG